MSDAELPSIKVTDEHLKGSKEQQQVVGSPTTEGGRPRSATSSEGMSAISHVISFMLAYRLLCCGYPESEGLIAFQIQCADKFYFQTMGIPQLQGSLR